MIQKTIKMMRFLFSLTTLLLVFHVSVGAISGGRDHDSKAVKKINKAYKVSKKVNLEVTNKYGQVIINTWAKDSIVVQVEVTGWGKDKEASEKLLERVEFEFNQVGDYVIVETLLDRSKGFFKDLWNSIGDYSKTLLGKNKLSIDIEIFMPVSGNVQMEQKFGDVYLDNILGEIDIDLSNGNLKIDEVTNDLKLNLSFGRANINTMKSGLFMLRSAELEVEKAENVELQSSSSVAIFSDLRALKIDSRNDRIRVDKLETLRGDGSFSTINIKQIGRTIMADMNYGELAVSKVPLDFKDIQLKGKSTDFDLMFEKEALVEVLVVALEEELTLSYGKYEKTIYNEDDELIKVTGTIGIGDTKSGKVDIYADGGRVKVQYALQ